MRWFRIALLFLLVFGLIINAPWVFQHVYAAYFRRLTGQIPPWPGPGAGERVLLLSPHPDDESACCGGLVRRALSRGAEVYVVWLTSGDGFEWDTALLDRTLRPSPKDHRDLGLRRMGEARAAAERLGLPGTHLFFLGYPDRGLLHLFLEHYTQPYRSPYTGLEAVSYPGSFHPGAPYTGQALEADLGRVVENVRPTLLLAPSPLDAHVDHRATGYLALRLLGTHSGLKGAFYIVHGGLEWPLPKGYHPALALEPPPRGRELPWLRLDLTPKEEEAKRQALLAHRSQMQILGRFLLAFVRKNELFSPEALPKAR